jgi:nicotinate-nucleotide adenylyltransferase
LNVIGIFGGTFDPIHHGHLRTALELRRELGLSEVRFVVSGSPPHRTRPQAPAELRLRMVEAAIAGESAFLADGRELARPGPSYMVDTLMELRGEQPEASLCLLLGMDAFSGLPTWSRWDQLLMLAHIVVVRRPGAPDPAGRVAQLLKAHSIRETETLAAEPGGCIYVASVTQLEISASALRRSIGEGLDPRYLVPDPVRDIIIETRCYA